MVFRLVVEDEVIYTSDAIDPGQLIEGFTLEAPLAPGDYDAIAVMSSFDGNELVLTSRVPVVLHVAG